MIIRAWLSSISIGFLLSAAAFGAARTQDRSSMFDFHSGFWMNLRQFIYADASSSLPPQKTRPTLSINQADADTIKDLSSSEQAAWKGFVAYYAEYLRYRKGIGGALGLLITDVMTPIEDRHPTLVPPDETQ